MNILEWLRDSTWSISKNGNPWRCVNGYHVVVYRQEDGWWNACVKPEEEGLFEHAPRYLARPRKNQHEAKMAAYVLVFGRLS